MFIHSIRLRNFLIHRETNLPLSPLTVFVGQNGGGKSAIFDAILNFSMVSRGNLREAFGPYPYSYSATIHRAATPIDRIGFEVTMSKNKSDVNRLEYRIDYRQVGMSELGPRFSISNEKLTRQPDGVVLFDRNEGSSYAIVNELNLQDDRSLLAAVRQAELAGKTSAIDEALLHCSRQISRFNRFRLNPAILAQPSRLPEPGRDIVPRIGYQGEDLAATLYHLNETNDPAWDHIVNKMKDVEPSFEEFEFVTVGTERIAFNAKYGDARQTVTSARLSSGTLIYIGLITLALTPNRPSMLMIEEPENGLTPQAVKSFYEVVRQLSTRESPEPSQVLISSHSPFVICEAWNGDDRDFIHQVKIQNGRAQVRKFSDAIKEQGIQLAKDKEGKRTVLGLATAEAVMSGYLA